MDNEKDYRVVYQLVIFILLTILAFAWIDNHQLRSALRMCEQDTIHGYDME